MSFEHIDNQFIDSLEASGIVDAYEYVLRKLIEEGSPKDRVYEKSALYLLEYKELVLKNNIRAKNAKKFYELSNPPKNKEKEVKAKEIIVSTPIPLRTKILLEQEENRPPQKIFETSIDELMKNKLNLISKNSFDENMRTNVNQYGTFATFVENENEKLRQKVLKDFKINTKFTNFQFIPMEEIENGNYGNDINDNNDIDNNNVNLNSDAEFLMPPEGARMNTGPSRKSTRKTKESKSEKSETVSSKSITKSQESKIRKISHNMAGELMKK